MLCVSSLSGESKCIIVKRVPTLNTMLSGFEDDADKLEDFLDAVSGCMC